MPYRGLDTRLPTRPLVDFIPDDSLHVDDEDAAFYAKDDDYLIHPHWKAMIQRISNRIPRRIKRYSFVYLGLLVLLFIGWKMHFGPKLSLHRQEIAEMEDTSKAAYGINVRPHFKDMVYIKSMDEKHLPKGNKRLIAVGDVHGCKEELEQLLKEVEFNEAHDHLILTGDIVAKGPDSAGVVSLAQKYGASCVRGNHEDKLLLSIAETSERKASLPGPTDNDPKNSDFLDEESHSHGADDYTLRKLAKQFSAEQITWLKELPVILKVERIPLMGEVLVVHAGLVADVPLDQQDPFQVMNMRTIDLKTRMPSEERKFTEWEKYWNHQQKKKAETERQTVIYGHDAKRGKNIKKFTKGLDSNCVRGGHLTALIIDSEGKTTVTQVKCTGYVE
ncbi:Metallo-dependent phosphatase [Lophiostoma macrostomum CBS 122681]|uniref:Metallo-dependent phosphatase n=1 Tax=Lophiostoma macrostomum CBS 122681 TaxID=1314788 RepID=A0A6A6TBR9_9PLEO|nr:Metallo-dependent phosphatase [Lophiostoma macrostomum CBS 122681]